MSKIAVISALERELVPLMERFNAENDNTWVEVGEAVYRSPAFGHEIFCSAVGIGKVNAAYRTAEIIRDYGPQLIVNIGYAGGMKADARRGDIIIGDSYVQADFDSVIDGCPPGVVPGAKPDIVPADFLAALEKQCAAYGYRYETGRIATGDFFLTDSARKAAIDKAFSPLAFDMESAAIAHVCAQKELPFVAIRVLSDLADDDAQTAFSSMSDPIEYRPVNVLLGALENFKGL